jgi:hypothetical protein
MPGMNTNIGDEGSFTNSPNPQDNATSGQTNNSSGVEKKPVQKPSMSPEEVLAIIQQAGEQWKFEVIQQIVDSVNAESMLLMSVDPTSATSVRAIASAINKSVSSFFPIGENDLFNQYKAQQAGATEQAMVQGAQQKQPQQQQSQQKTEKKASEDLSDFVYNVVCEKIASTGYFEQFNEKVASEDEKNKIAEYIQNDIYSVIEKVAKGMEKFAEENDIDFSDPNTWEALQQLIEDGTLIEIGEAND